MRQRMLIVSSILLSGCSQVGVFGAFDYFSQERLFVRDDCTFSLEFWVDDGGLVVCTESGSWRRLGAFAIETQVEARSGLGCPRLTDTERWTLRWGKWHRSEYLPFKRTSIEQLNADIFGPSPNQSFQRTRRNAIGSLCSATDVARR